MCQVNYLHSHGLAHTELRLENLHVSPVDRHIKVSIRLLFCKFAYLKMPQDGLAPESSMLLY